LCEAILVDAMYELPGDKSITTFTVDREYAERKVSKSKIAYMKKAA